MNNRAARSGHDSEGFHAHLFLSGGSYQAPQNQWEAAYHSPKLARVLVRKSRWKTARTKTTVRTVTLASPPKQLAFDFSPQAGAETRQQSPVLSRLEEAADKGNERTFISVLRDVKWETMPASDFVRVIKLALMAGTPTAAQHVYTEGIKYHADNSEIKEYARLFAPSRSTTRTLPPNPTLQANREWLKANRGKHRGQWIAVRNGELLATASSLEELTRRVGDTTNVLLTRA